MIIWEKWIWGAQQKTCLVPSGRRSSVEADADPEGKETKKKDLGGGEENKRIKYAPSNTNKYSTVVKYDGK